MRTIALFNNKGGVGKTTLVYHLAHMLPRVGVRTIAIDLDPQANLTSAFFDETELEPLWEDGKQTILQTIDPILTGRGDIGEAEPIEVADGLHVLAGNLALSRFEDRLAESWPKSVANDEAALRVTTAFFRTIQSAASRTSSAVALIDVGPNLGAINRAALLAADRLLIPLAADLFSLQGLRNLGPTIRQWRQTWARMREFVSAPFELPRGEMLPAGYVVLQHAIRLDRPAKHYAKWMSRIPSVYREAVLDQKKAPPDPDPALLATLRNYRSLMPMAQDARKPMFDLRPADGAMGSHAALVRTCHEDFENLARKLVEAADVELP
jgi:cellulose biosynthesis protein BcsQ